MVNDTTTLNGALAELGETMAANITTKGVSASASDGLTTLAGKILQISGGGGGPTTLFQPPLDGTDSKYTITGSTTISDGVMSGGSSYLTGGWDNTGDWVCTFEANIPNDQSAISLYADGETQRDKNQIKITGNYHKNITAYTNGVSESSQTTTVPIGTWFDVSLTKSGNTLTAVLNNNTYTVTWSLLTTLSEVHLGTDTWGTSASIRNVLVQSGSGGGGSNCTQYQTEISNAIEYINGSGS